jgi:hypothetical protein
VSAVRSIAWPTDDGSAASRLIGAPQRSLWTGQRGDWVVLPSGDDTAWSVVAADREGLRRAREVVTAFVGPSTARLSGSPSTALLQIGHDEPRDVHVADLRAERPTELFEALQRLVAVRASSPRSGHVAPRALAHLIRDFRLALFDQDASRAEGLLRRLRDEARLSGENLDFLEIEMLGRLGRWRELRNLPWFLQTARAPRPIVITGFMIEAVWRVEFVDAGADDPRTALERYGELPADFLRLYDAIDVPASPGGRRVVALRSLDQGSRDRFDRVRALAEGADRAWIDALVRAEDPTLVLPPGERARKLLADGRYADVVKLAVDSGADPVILESAVRAVAEIESPELAIELRPLLKPEQMTGLPTTPGFVRSLDRVYALAADKCDSWSDWIERVARPEPWSAAAEVLRRDARGWSLEPLRRGPDADRAGRNLETALGGANADAIEQGMDLLCELAASLAPEPGAARVIDAVLYGLLDRAPTEALGNAFLSLTQAVLRAGPTEQRYADVLDVCLSSQQLFGSRVLIPVALDLLDEFAMHPSPDMTRRRVLAATAFDAFRAHASRGHLTRDEARLAELLLDELGLETGPLWVPTAAEEEPSIAEEEPWSLLDGRTVVLYTLLEGLGPRFEERVRQFCPTASVVVLSDHVASDRLRAAVREADHVLVDTRHAKHAATAGIDAIRPKSRQLFPDGKGVSSFVRCLGQALRELVTAT